MWDMSVCAATYNGFSMMLLVEKKKRQYQAQTAEHDE